MNLREVPLAKVEELRKIVETDFPGDAMLQEVHLARLILEEKMGDLSPQDKVAYLNHGHARRNRAA